ncbi:hypothetical protein W02_32390 [Nitrospira sp. KM1]|uniref:hypothetical protein n=1 Tax=Nitrospira sp. KM1 TaxID=1936990 RepID=UPI0013A72AE5|nr:hypothetical protein [Nitrospira sp. KM1]BCA56099.1 hypothetical protein W02_32390 [Nitrospira sp. KM1]
MYFIGILSLSFKPLLKMKFFDWITLLGLRQFLIPGENHAPSFLPHGFIPTLFGLSLSVALTPSNDFEQWKSDGTADGTLLVKNIKPGTPDSRPIFLSDAGGTLFSLLMTGCTGGTLGS